ncbi:MAG: glycosyltransferase family 2 protein [Algicola sp.]|nr:glycosyltransferase family 2 protein [Algicola sp.]
MLFQFYKYIQPTHYFLLRQEAGGVFPNPEGLPKTVLEQVTPLPYASPLAQAYDKSWQALQKGWVGAAAPLTHIEPLSVLDNYQFVRAYFKTPWVWYVLLLRLLAGKHPLNELQAFLKSRHMPKASLYKPQLAQPEWHSIAWPKNQPLVSVVIPTLNRYPYLKDVLKDLEKQEYKNFEVLVVDQSQPFQEAFYSDWPFSLKVIRQKEKALWLARNTAIKQSQGEYILLFDDDSRVAPDWITNHLKGLEAFKADISSGVSISKIGDKVPEHYSMFKISDQLDTGNAMIKKAVFKKIGLFDRQFEKQRMGDGEFGARAHVHGLLNVSNPQAKRLHLKVGTGGLRDMGSWDAFRTKNLLDPRPIPSVLYYFRRYYGNQAAKYAILKTVPLSMMPYQFKGHKVLKVVGVFVSVLLLPLVVFQVFKSWRLASKKLKEGPMIEALE